MQALAYLIDIFFGLYLTVVLLRVWLQWARADFYNPFSQFVVKATNPVVAPLRRVIPGFAGIDWASVVLALLVATGKWLALSLVNAASFSMSWLPLISLLTVLKEAGFLIFWILLLRAILSWVSQGRSPIEYVMTQLTEPLLAPVRRVIPNIGGLDLSVLAVFIFLQFLNILLSSNIPYWHIL